MFKVRTLEPGTYRAYTLGYGAYANMINLFVIFPVIDGIVRPSRPLSIHESEFDDDRERSSIWTSPVILAGDHNCKHEKFSSNAVVNLLDADGYGLTRTHYTNLLDFVDNVYGKRIYDYHGDNYTDWGYSGPTYYTMNRTSDHVYFKREWRGYNGNRWDEIQDVSYSFDNDDYFTVTTHYVDTWNGVTRQEYTRTALIHWNQVQGSQWADFTVSTPKPMVDRYIARWKNLLRDLPKFMVSPPKADVYGACLQAAMDYNAYDINLIEALAGFSGLDDLMPVGLSKELSEELSSFLESPNLFTAFTRTAYMAACTYLYSKYVTANNIADIEQLLGLSGSKRFAEFSDIAQKLSNSLTRKQEAEWDFRMAKMAQKIVYKYDYHQDSYGGVTTKTSNATDICTVESLAHLCATPGPLRDMTTMGIILDDIGLSLRASRIAQAVKLEFVANWFLPIEDTLDRIEFNATHLNQLYRIQKLNTSTKEVHNLNVAEIAEIYGLDRMSEGSISITSYHRYVSDEFPTTSFQGISAPEISLSRILQGSALIIATAGR